MFRSSFLGLLLLGFSLTIIEGNAEGECKDTQTSAKCAKWKKMGKCAKEKFAIECMKTCDKCDGGGAVECKDTMKGCKMKKKNGKCEEEEIANKCMKTCGLCDKNCTTTTAPRTTTRTITTNKGSSNCSKQFKTPKLHHHVS